MGMTITYPWGNDHQPFTTEHSGLTPFQETTVRTIVASDQFDFACNRMELEPGSSYKGPVGFLWYDKSGDLHLTRIGQRRVLREVVSS